MITSSARGVLLLVRFADDVHLTDLINASLIQVSLML